LELCDSEAGESAETRRNGLHASTFPTETLSRLRPQFYMRLRHRAPVEPLRVHTFALNYTRGTQVFGFQGACIDAEDKAETRRCSGTTASVSNAGIRVKVRTIKAKNLCTAGIKARLGLQLVQKSEYVTR